MEHRNRAFWATVFLLPASFLTLIFMIIPIIGAFSLSFYDWDILTLPSFVGLSNFIKLVGDPTFLAALKNTMVFILGYTPLVMVSGLLCALILNMKIPARTFLRAAFFLPVVSSWVAVALLWQWLFNSEVGLINYGLSLLGIQGPAWLYSETWAMPAIIITSVWKDTGFVMMIFLGGLQGISRTYYEAARIDGATKVHTFWFITRPLLSPTTFFILVVTLINSFQVFEQVYVMTGGGPAGSTSVLVQQIYLNTARYSRMGYASSMALVLFALIMSVTVVQMILQKRWVHYDV